RAVCRAGGTTTWRSSEGGPAAPPPPRRWPGGAGEWARLGASGSRASTSGEAPLAWTNEILLALGARDTIAASGFVEKWGASFRGPDGADERYADFQTAPERPTPQTFQVLRERFDETLLRHSEKSGARVLEEHQLLDARFDPDGVTLSFTDRHGRETTLRAGVVVDASGRTGVLAKRFGRHEYDPLLRNID